MATRLVLVQKSPGSIPGEATYFIINYICWEVKPFILYISLCPLFGIMALYPFRNKVVYVSQYSQKRITPSQAKLERLYIQYDTYVDYTDGTGPPTTGLQNNQLSEKEMLRSPAGDSGVFY